MPTFPQGLKPSLIFSTYGTLRLRSGPAIEVVPFQDINLFRGSLALKRGVRSSEATIVRKCRD